MNEQKFTQKSIEVINNAQSLAVEHQNVQIEQAHLLYALLEQKDGLINELLKKIGIDTANFLEGTKSIINKIPGVSGPGRERDKVYISQDTDKALVVAEKTASKMKDEYISVEHIMLGLLEAPDTKLKELFKTFNLNKEAFLSSLMTVRGNTRVTSDNPEDTYDVLKKYGSELVELARKQKLDPVIGRDEEIRNVVRILSRKTKNNPVLIGEPGVGKTAIAEGLALRIVKGDVPENLKNRKIFSLDMSTSCWCKI